MAKFKITFKDGNGIILSQIRIIDNRSNIPYMIEVRNEALETAKQYSLVLFNVEEIAS